VVIVSLSAPLLVALATQPSGLDVRDLERVTLASLPGAILVGWWLGWRMVRPLEKLRRQVTDKIDQGAPRPDLDLGRMDEFGDLAAAFNALLARLEARTRANEAFIADLAHELKNPVAAIRAAAESLSGGAVDEERALRLARILDDSSRRLEDLVGQLLELARAEAGMPDEPRSEIDLVALAKGVAARVSIDVRFSGVKLAVDAPESAIVRCVPQRIEAALRNLVDNGASFAAPEGTVSIAIAPKDGRVLLRVTDSGPGIRPEDLPRVFDRFFTTRRSEHGTGLGLALVRAVAEAHGGSARVRSELGKGATFEIDLPEA
jgi:signal transduction histidine kinase